MKTHSGELCMLPLRELTTGTWVTQQLRLRSLPSPSEPPRSHFLRLTDLQAQFVFLRYSAPPRLFTNAVGHAAVPFRVGFDSVLTSPNWKCNNFL